MEALGEHMRISSSSSVPSEPVTSSSIPTTTPGGPPARLVAGRAPRTKRSAPNDDVTNPPPGQPGSPPRVVLDTGYRRRSRLSSRELYRPFSKWCYLIFVCTRLTRIITSPENRSAVKPIQHPMIPELSCRSSSVSRFNGLFARRDEHRIHGVVVSGLLACYREDPPGQPLRRLRRG